MRFPGKTFAQLIPLRACEHRAILKPTFPSFPKIAFPFSVDAQPASEARQICLRLCTKGNGWLSSLEMSTRFAPIGAVCGTLSLYATTQTGGVPQLLWFPAVPCFRTPLVFWRSEASQTSAPPCPSTSTPARCGKCRHRTGKADGSTS